MWQWHQMGFLGWLLMVAFWIVVLVLPIRTATSTQQKTDDSALRILDERLARGEIGPEEYEERRRLLISEK